MSVCSHAGFLSIVIFIFENCCGLDYKSERYEEEKKNFGSCWKNSLFSVFFACAFLQMIFESASTSTIVYLTLSLKF